MVNAMEMAPEAQEPFCAFSQLGQDPHCGRRSLRMQRTLERTFAQEHYMTVIACDGQSGLDLFRSERPLAVVLDLILPNISGRELCRMFKQISEDTPIIVLSAISDVADKGLAARTGRRRLCDQAVQPARVDGPRAGCDSPPEQALAADHLPLRRL